MYDKDHGCFPDHPTPWSSFDDDSVSSSSSRNPTPRNKRRQSPPIPRKRSRDRDRDRDYVPENANSENAIPHGTEPRTTEPRIPGNRRERRRQHDRFAAALKVADDSLYEFVGIVPQVIRIVLQVVRIFRTPVVYAFALMSVYGILAVIYAVLVGAAVSSLCVLPGVASFASEMCGPDPTVGRYSDYPDFPKLMQLQAGFEEVVVDSHDFVVFSGDLKHSETAVRDLNSLVKASKLVCKDVLSRDLVEYVTIASEVVEQLSTFGGRIHGMIDRLIAVDTSAIAYFEESPLKVTATDSSSGPFGIFSYFARISAAGEVASAERRMLGYYSRTCNTTESSIQRLLVEGNILLRRLQDLEDQLNVVEDTVQQEIVVIGEARDEVLAQMWTHLGGNKRQLARMMDHQYLLQNISQYRKRALRHLQNTLLKLQTMKGELKNIAEVVSEPVTAESEGGTPIAVQIATIRKGVDRLEEGMKDSKAKGNMYNQMVAQAYDELVRNSRGR